MSFSNFGEIKKKQILNVIQQLKRNEKKKQTLLKGEKNYEGVKEIAIFKSLIFTNPAKGSFQKGRFHKKYALEK